MPKKRSISRKDWAADTLRENFTAEESDWQEGELFFRGRVVEVHKGFAFVSSEHVIRSIDLNTVWLGTVPGRFLLGRKSTRKLLAVGDRVLCERQLQCEKDLPSCSIMRVAPRRTSLSRVDPFNPAFEHVIAANIDVLVIVASFVTPPLSFALIDRYLVLAAMRKIQPVIVLNKLDLLHALPEAESRGYTNRVSYYKSLGYQVLMVQADGADLRDQQDLQELQRILVDIISVFSGHSGVGKSSLINLFSPVIPQAVEEQGALTDSGRHITTYASLLSLQTGGFVIDTPGIKQFSLGRIVAHELENYFPEFKAYRGGCRYRVCLHDKEPVCGVKEAVAAGDICRERYLSYLALKDG